MHAIQFRSRRPAPWLPRNFQAYCTCGRWQSHWASLTTPLAVLHAKHANSKLTPKGKP